MQYFSRAASLAAGHMSPHNVIQTCHEFPGHRSPCSPNAFALRIAPLCQKPIFNINLPHFSVQYAFCIIGSTAAVIPPPQTPLVVYGVSSVMVVDNGFRFVGTVPARS